MRERILWLVGVTLLAALLVWGSKAVAQEEDGAYLIHAKILCKIEGMKALTKAMSIGTPADAEEAFMLARLTGQCNQYEPAIPTKSITLEYTFEQNGQTFEVWQVEAPYLRNQYGEPVEFDLYTFTAQDGEVPPVNAPREKHEHYGDQHLQQV